MFSWKSLILHHQQLFVLMLQGEQDLSPIQHPQRDQGPAPVLPPALSIKPEMSPCPHSNIPKAEPCPSNPLGKERGTDSPVCVSIWVQEGFFIHPQGS